MSEQVMHIPRTWSGHYLYRATGLPPTARCGVTIWRSVDSDRPHRECAECRKHLDSDLTA